MHPDERKNCEYTTTLVSTYLVRWCLPQRCLSALSTLGSVVC